MGIRDFFVGLVFIIFFSECKSQINEDLLLGEWVVVKTMMQDGDLKIPVYPDYEDYQELIFNKSQFARNHYPALKHRKAFMDYTLKGNRIKVSKYYSYLIETLSRDSLIISEQIKGAKPADLHKLYLVRKDIKFEEQREKFNGTQHIIANKFYIPKYTEKLEYYLNKNLEGVRKSLNLKGEIVLYPNKRQIETFITYRDKEDPFREETIVRLLNETFDNWNLDSFQQYDSVTIPFVIIMERTETYRGLRIKLLAKTFTQLLGLYGIPMEKKNEAAKFYNMGLNAYQKQEYLKAIEYFTAAHQSDYTLVDALYNRSVCYYNLKEYTKACTDWYFLSELGQLEGKRLLEENCKVSYN